MNAPDLAAFFAMGGYGLYVWGSVGMCALAFLAEGLALRARRRALLRELAEDAAPAAATRAPVLTRRGPA